MSAARYEGHSFLCFCGHILWRTHFCVLVDIYCGGRLFFAFFCGHILCGHFFEDIFYCIYLFAIHSTCTYEYFTVHKKIVQYGRLAQNRRYKLRNHRHNIEIMLKSTKINNNNLLTWSTTITHTGVTPTCP